MNLNGSESEKKSKKQESLQVGCVPSVFLVPGGGSVQPPWMQTPSPLNPDPFPPESRPPPEAEPPPVRPPQAPPPFCGQPNTCENITLPQTWFAGGKNDKIKRIFRFRLV